MPKAKLRYTAGIVYAYINIQSWTSESRPSNIPHDSWFCVSFSECCAKYFLRYYYSEWKTI